MTNRIRLVYDEKKIGLDEYIVRCIAQLHLSVNQLKMKFGFNVFIYEPFEIFQIHLTVTWVVYKSTDEISFLKALINVKTFHSQASSFRAILPELKQFFFDWKEKHESELIVQFEASESLEFRTV